MLKPNELELVGDAIETIHDVTGEAITDIVDALIGVAWDEVTAGHIKEHCWNAESDNQEED